MYNTVCFRTQILSAMLCQATPSYIKVNCEFPVISQREDAPYTRETENLFLYCYDVFFYYLCYSYYIDISCDFTFVG
mgnify:CR=1 FL=1